MKPQPLTPDEIAAALATLPGWSDDGAAIGKRFACADFGAAMRFMQRCVPAIEALDHHPDWSNRYDVVEVRLTTHDLGGRVSARDVALARAIEAAWNEAGP